MEKDKLDLNNPAGVLMELAQEQIDELGRGILNIYHAMNKRMAELKRMNLDEARARIQENVDTLTREDYEKVAGTAGTVEARREGFTARARVKARQMFEINMLVDLNPELNAELDTQIEKRALLLYPPEVEPLPKMPQRPKKHVSPNNKLMTALTTGEIINAGAMNLAVMPDDSITTYVMATYDIDKDMAPFNLSPFERTVMDAVCSIYRQANIDGDTAPVMTPASIYKAMPGAGVKAKPEIQEKIAEAVHKMRHVYVTLDASSELLKLKKIKPGEKYTKETSLILAEEHTYRRQNGTTSVGWQIFKKPIAYEYAELTGQIVNVPARVLQIEGVEKETGEPDGYILSLSENRRELLAYLVRRVAVIKNAHNRAVEVANWRKNREAGKPWQEFMTQSTTILYDTARIAAGIDTTRKNTIKDCKDFCRIVFDYWKAIDYIPGYREVKEGRTARGLEIVF